MKKAFFLGLVMTLALANISWAQTDFQTLSKTLGITHLQLVSTQDITSVYTIEADSVLINGFKTNLSAYSIEIINSAAEPSIKIGQDYTLIQQSESIVFYQTPTGETIIDFNGEQDVFTQLDNENRTRFMMMLILLNNLKDNQESARLASWPNRCGTWDVMAYGNSSTGSQINASGQASTFAGNNSNCSQVGTNTSCAFNSNHICITTHTFSCTCSFTIPYIGIGF